MAGGTGGSFTPPGGRVTAATGITSSTGDVTFTWPAGAFTTPPVVAVGVEAGPGVRSWSITANSPTSTTINVLGAPVVSLLGIQILAASVPSPGITVHAIATAAT